MTNKIFSNKELQLDVRYEDAATRVVWTGRSTARDPGSFIAPVLAEALKLGGEASKPVLIDFRQLEYMNSSTITPVIRVLHEARKGQQSVAILYQKELKWQELSFSALAIFQTDDKRIEIRGV